MATVGSAADLTALRVRAVLASLLAAAFVLGALAQLVGTVSNSRSSVHTSATILSCSGTDTRGGGECVISYQRQGESTHANLQADGPFVPKPSDTVPVWVDGGEAYLGGWRPWLSTAIFLAIAAALSLLALTQVRAYWQREMPKKS